MATAGASPDADATAAEPDARGEPLLLAPLDPLVYDRRLTARFADHARPVGRVRAEAFNLTRYG